MPSPITDLLNEIEDAIRSDKTFTADMFVLHKKLMKLKKKTPVQEAMFYRRWSAAKSIPQKRNVIVSPKNRLA